ncbi:hypothetical protein REPUB_Repub13aG0126100 [Reevesia pubescens]
MAGGKVEFSLREIKANIGGGRVSGSGREKLTSSFDLVEQMQFLFVRIVRARDLPLKTVNRIIDPFVEVKVGNYKATTKYFEKKPNLEWSQVFAFTRDRIQTTSVEITVRDKELRINENMIGKLTINLPDIPTCLPPDSPLASQWFRLEDKNGVNVGRGELMLAIWFGTQADDVFPDAWHSDAAIVSGESFLNTRSKVYLSPRLWYLRVNIIQAQDLVPGNKNRNPEVYVKAIVGDVILRTRVSADKNVNPKWNEDLMFVVAEPFRDPLILSVEDKLGNNMVECLGRCVIRLSQVDQRMLPLAAAAKWFNLEKIVLDDGRRPKELMNFYSKLNMRVTLDGGYHVFDESIRYGSDYRPTMKKLWTAMIGVLELGILSASSLQPMKLRDGRETTDSYCVAKYGPKWVKTRTVVDSFAPKWNEQYTWEVYDPYTVLTIGVFDDCHLHGGDVVKDGKDPSIGKVRIRLSTLLTDKIYTYSYPLLVLQPNGVKKMGEIQLAVRFTCSSYMNLFLAYAMNPLIPRMHHILPLSIYQLDSLRQQATRILCSRLSRTEPPLRKEVVEYMLDGGSQMWSLRKAKANFQRLLATLKCFSDAWKWFSEIRRWKNGTTTIIVISLYCIAIIKPHLILPTMTLYCLQVGICGWWKRPRHPTHIDVKLCLADAATADELDEEFDTFPSSRQSDVLRMRYDRLRSIAGRVVSVIGDIATQAERFHSLLNWQDSRITSVFLACCLIGIFPLYHINLKVFLILVGFYVMRPPLFGNDVLNAPQNFLSRLPTKADYML